MEQGNYQVAQAGQKLWRMVTFNLAGIFAKGIIAHPVQTVFNVPVVAPKLQKFFRVSFFR